MQLLTTESFIPGKTQLKFPDGVDREYSPNKIVASMFTQYDLEGNTHLLLDCIIDFKVDEHGMQMADKDVIVKGKKYLKKITKGWHMCVNRKDGTSAWQ